MILSHFGTHFIADLALGIFSPNETKCVLVESLFFSLVSECLSPEESIYITFPLCCVLIIAFMLCEFEYESVFDNPSLLSHEMIHLFVDCVVQLYLGWGEPMVSSIKMGFMFFTAHICWQFADENSKIFRVGMGCLLLMHLLFYVIVGNTFPHAIFSLLIQLF